MAKVTFGKSVLQVEGLEVKYDIVPVSSSLARLIGDKDSASIVQQLYYWLEQGYGEVIEGVRWIYKPVKEWIEEVFPTYTSYQLGKIMKRLSDRDIIRREKLFTKHQIQRGDRFWWQPKNQTYYYSLNYEKLQELAENFTSPLNKGSDPASPTGARECAGGQGGSNSPNNEEPTSDRPSTENAPTNAETIENSVFSKTQILSNSDLEHTKNFDCSKDNTNITSKENNSIDQSHPHLPCEWNDHEENNQEINSGNRQVTQQEQSNSFNSTITEQDTNIGQVEEKINQNNSANKAVVQESVQVEAEKPKLKKSKGVKSKRESKAPWENQEQFKAFYSALIQAIPIVANARSPQGLAQTIIRQLRSGNPHTYWDDFAAGMPIGASTKPEWEVEPGVPYPQFIEYLTEKLKAGNNTKTDEQTRNEVFGILEKPRQAKAFWGQFKRSVVNVSEQVERDRALGVSSPNTPVWTRERIEPSIEEAAAAGKKITAVNDATQAILESTKNPQLESKDPPPVPQFPSLPISTSSNESEQVPSLPDPWSDQPSDMTSLRNNPKPTMREMLAERGVKGFCKPMPKVSQAELTAEERKQTKPKTNIAQMSLAEINDYLKDPVLRAQLTPQLIDSDYELITDELGQVIAVKAPPDDD